MFIEYIFINYHSHAPCFHIPITGVKIYDKIILASIEWLDVDYKYELSDGDSIYERISSTIWRVTYKDIIQNIFVLMYK